MKAFLTRRSASIVIVGFWVLMMGLLGLREWRARQSPGNLKGYAALLRGRLLNTERQMGIYHGDTRVGMTRTAYRLRDGEYEVDSWTRLALPFLGQRPASIRALLALDPQLQLTGLRGWLTLPVLSPQSIKFEGTVAGEELEVKFIHQDEVVFRTKMPYRGEEILSNVFSPFTTMPALSVGKTWQIRMFNPLSRNFETATAVVEADTTIAIDGEAVRVFQAKVRGRSVEATAWVTPEGEVVRQAVPRWGLVLLKEDPISKGL